jgi:ubiquinone/menaquinone biosynthesis C-methylase UbiE
MDQVLHEENYKQWNGLSEKYHNDRPKPPDVIVQIILSWLQREPDTVVDVGCGTGLSTVIWNGIAKEIVGIEPNDDMRSTAIDNYDSENISFITGVSNDTGLPSNYTDIITVSQAFHWMDINSTLFEFYRILKPGGILAIYDFVLPPVCDWEIEKTNLEMREKFSNIVYSQERPPVHNDKDTYNDRIKSFGKFRFTRKVECHNTLFMTPLKLADFLIGISNACFAIKTDPSLSKDLDDFYNFVKAKYENDIEVLLPYKLVMAVK